MISLLSVFVHANRDPMWEPALTFHRLGSADQIPAWGSNSGCQAQWRLLYLWRWSELSCHYSGLCCLCFWCHTSESWKLLPVFSRQFICLFFETESVYGPCCPGYYVDLAVLELIFSCLCLWALELKVHATMLSLSKSFLALTVKSLPNFKLIFIYDSSRDVLVPFVKRLSVPL